MMVNNTVIEPGARWACSADRIFDGENVLHDQALIIEGGMITTLLPVATIPRGIPVLSAPGCTMLPGLIDTHSHFMRWEGPLYLAYGVTTIRDVANPLDWMLNRRAEAGHAPWPRIYCTGPAIDGPIQHWAEISLANPDLESACENVRMLAAAGVDGIKLYVRLPGEWVADITRTAHDAGLPVMMHCTATGVLAPARAGIDEFFHLDGLVTDLWSENPGGWLEVWGHEDFPNTWEQQQQAADEIAELGLITTPTLTVWDFFCRSRFRDEPAPQDAPFIPQLLLDYLLPEEPEPARGEQWIRAIENAQRFLGLLVERQACILPGTDVPWTFHLPGHMLWRELALLAGCGMTPLATLRAATSEAARVLRADRLGRLAPGYIADLVIVEGDPTQAIPDRPVIKTVAKAGHIYDPAELLALAPGYADHVEQDPLAIAFKRQFAPDIQTEESTP